MMILLLLFLGFGIYYLVTNKGIANIKLNGSKTPEEILMNRYVNGEIDEETYARMKETINR